MATSIEKHKVQGIVVSDENETHCPQSPDGAHCEWHWYEDDGPCCYCGDNTSSSARGFVVAEDLS